VSRMIAILGKPATTLSRRGFVKTLSGASIAGVAWMAGVRDAFASYCYPTTGTGNYGCGGSCPGSLHRVHCCCLEFTSMCSGGVCPDSCSCASNHWVWYCTDCSSQDWACMECPNCRCSAANYQGHYAPRKALARVLPL
jgi:hypothetical protein